MNAIVPVDPSDRQATVPGVKRAIGGIYGQIPVEVL